MKIFIFITFFLTACAYSDLRSLFEDDKYDCQNGWRAVSDRVCIFERLGY